MRALGACLRDIDVLSLWRPIPATRSVVDTRQLKTSKSLECSLIVSVYNQAKQLALILASAAHQTRKRFEIVVADDGSSDGVEQIIHRFREEHPAVPVQYVRHADAGFRKCIILNEAFRTARGNYLIIVDGDMILHREFVENHWRYRGSDRMLCGNRGVKLRQAYTAELLAERRCFSSSLWSLLWMSTRGQLDKPFRGTVLHNKVLRRLAVSERPDLSGCNFSLFKGALERVNGMDETILEYGFEDYDLSHRLKLAGLKLVNVSKCCNTYHLYHPKKTRWNAQSIKGRIDKSREVQCRYGLKRLEVGSAVVDWMVTQ